MTTVCLASVVIDTSALIALLVGEDSSSRLIAAIDATTSRKISAATVAESSLVLLGKYGDAGEAQLDRLIAALRAEIVAVDSEQVSAARDAAQRYGKGRHVAALNFGDCFSYALAATTGEPLLFVGSDFAQTDIERVEW